MDTSHELRLNAPCYETVYCFKFKSLVFSSRVCAGAPAIPSWKFDSSNARQSVVGATTSGSVPKSCNDWLQIRNQSSNAAYLAPWQRKVVRTRWPCLCCTAGLYEPGSYQANHSRCTITTCSTKLIGPVQSAFITQGFNWQFDCFLLI